MYGKHRTWMSNLFRDHWQFILHREVYIYTYNIIVKYWMRIESVWGVAGVGGKTISKWEWTKLCSADGATCQVSIRAMIGMTRMEQSEEYWPFNLWEMNTIFKKRCARLASVKKVVGFVTDACIRIVAPCLCVPLHEWLSYWIYVRMIDSSNFHFWKIL